MRYARQYAVLGIFLLAGMLSMTGAAAQSNGFDGALRSLTVGENITLNATVTNSLPVEDTLTIVFSGDAITDSRIVRPYFPDACQEISTSNKSMCRIKELGSGESKNITFTLQGTAFGQERLVATVNSSQTGLSSQDQVEIRVKANFAPVTVSSPGLTSLEFLAAALLAAAAVFYLRR